jgi:signal transduction histidine kinase/CheY-like chemotaxis protein
MPSRIASALFVATAACVFTGHWIPLAWLAIVCLGQAVDHWVAAPIRRRPNSDPAPRAKFLYIASMAGRAVLFSSISVYCWFAGDLAGKVFAILMPAGTVLAMAVRIGLSRRLLIAGWAPHAAYLIGLPLASAWVSPADDLVEMLCLSMAGLLFLTHVLVAVRRIEDGAKALQRAMADFDAQREAAERANAAKSEFLATITHEIRTPMNAVVAASDLLRHTQLNPQQSEQVAMLANASEVLMGLLNDVLDLSKIESGKIILESAPFNLVEKLERGAQLWRPRAAQKGVALTFDPTGLPLKIQTDPLRLQQILFNLLSNAVKFTDRGEISVRGGRDLQRGRLWFEVADTGCGMDEATASRIFLSFEQAHAGTARQHGGTGLGLAISRRLAELLGGALEVTSAPGQGSTFRLEMPLVELEGPSSAPYVPPPLPVTLAPQPEAVAPAVEDEPATETDSAEAGEQIDVLVAEDHAVNQRIVRLILEPIGCRLTVVENGADAVEAAKARPFDVILMDMQMPVMDGIEATRLIQDGGGPNANTPIVALTANALAEHRAQWAAVGVNLFAAKPVNMQSLIGVVMQALEEGRTRTEARLAKAHG